MRGKNYFVKTVVITLLVTFSLFLSVPAGKAAGEPGYVSYQVQRGDFLWLIGWKFETTVEAIRSLNKLSSIQIVPGQLLRIPKSTGFVRDILKTVDYFVKPGDSLFRIGQKFSSATDKIKVANGLAGTAIYPGQVLSVPLPLQQRYTVQPGDTMFLMAQRFKASVEGLQLVNRMNNSSALWIGQVLFVPAGSTPGLPIGGQWGEIPPGVVLYHVKQGENLWLLAKNFNTTEAAMTATNHLHTDLMMINQPLFIPQNSSQSAGIPYPVATKKEGFGELLEWEYASWILDIDNIATLQDLVTGKSFKVRRLGGSNHADMEPLTPVDTAVMKEIFGGQWSWDRRAVLVSVDGQLIAGSMAGMPHSIKTIPDNEFPGHFDLHFLNSRTHYDNTIDPLHQSMVQKAAGN